MLKLSQNASDDPVRQGPIASLARPGGNITGFTDIAEDLGGKQLDLLNEAVPKATRIAAVWHTSSPAAVAHVKETEKAARALGVQLLSLEVRSPDEFENAFLERLSYARRFLHGEPLSVRIVVRSLRGASTRPRGLRRFKARCH